MGETKLPMADRGKPAWLRAGLPGGRNYKQLKRLLDRTGLHTVCKEAMCPNIAECWEHGTMTVMILGDVCTRGCRFCAVRSGDPGGSVDADEPRHVAEAVTELGLHYVVLTSVDRDDLPDGGAAHFAAVVRAIKSAGPSVLVEVLTPDFGGDAEAIEAVLESGVDVFAHNIETVRELTPAVRDPRCSYSLSLDVLAQARRSIALCVEGVRTKSSLMLGLGETDSQIEQAMLDLRDAGVEILTLGQYLRPTKKHVPVSRYLTPGEFAAYRQRGIDHGFKEVFSGPLVRSSYRAEKVFLGDHDNS